MKRSAAILLFASFCICVCARFATAPTLAQSATQTAVLAPPPECNAVAAAARDGRAAGRGRAGNGGFPGRDGGIPPEGFGGRGEHKLALGPDLGYTAIANALPLPDGMHYDSVPAVGVNSKGHIFVYDRGPAVLFEFDQNEKFLRAFGEHYAARPHGLRIDAADNIWITDVSDNTVMKLNPAGQIVMILGTRCQSGTWDETAGKHVFNQPTDLGIAANGDIFVSTGHGGDDPRIVRFDKNGKFITTWSLKEATDTPTTRHDIHTMVVDSKGTVYAADREMKRIRIYDSNGKHLRDIEMDYLVSGLYISKDGSPWMVSGQDGQVMKLDWNGKVLGATGKIGKGNNEYGEAHMMTMSLKNEIYVADTVNNRVQKLVKK
jgi:DNA-binding beta-propeller fold protein YncE